MENETSIVEEFWERVRSVRRKAVDAGGSALAKLGGDDLARAWRVRDWATVMLRTGVAIRGGAPEWVAEFVARLVYFASEGQWARVEEVGKRLLDALERG